MSRPLRIEYEGAWYHVMNRGRARQTIFPGRASYEAFLATLAEAAHRFRLGIHAYCLMPNHYHLLVQTPLGNLSRAMRHVDGLYTQRYNRLEETDGPLFRGRYKAILVDADAYLLSVSRYIHRNPVEAEPPLVADLADWPWSSYPAYLGRASAPAWLETGTVLGALNATDPAGYRGFVESGVEEAIERFYANQRATPILGDETFRERALAGTSPSSENPKPSRPALHTAEAVIAAVAAEWGVEPVALGGRGYGVSPAIREARRLAMWLCREETDLTLAAIGEHFGGIHYSAVSQHIRRLRESLEGGGRLARAAANARARLADPGGEDPGEGQHR